MKKLIVTLSIAVLASCAGETEPGTGSPDMGYYCAPQGNLAPICGFEDSPEDAEWLPDGTGLIVSEFTGIGSASPEGRLSLVNTESGEITLLHDVSMQNPQEDENVWGASDVTSKASFSPHGIHLSQRSDGRWQLLVVNHAEIETIDFFELLKIDGAWVLEWRGGVDTANSDFHNDVFAAGDGFYTTRYFQGTKDQIENLVFEYTGKIENGVVKRWTPQDGWSELAGTAGVNLNGILWNESADELVVSEWGSSRVNVFTGEGELKHRIEAISHPDNISWNEAKDAYLVASKETDLATLAACAETRAETCVGEFNIYEVQPGGSSKAIRFTSDGAFWGPPSNALEKDGRLYLGSFGGSRILVIE